MTGLTRNVARLTATLCLVASAPLLAHDEPNEQIDRLSEEIARFPIDAELYLARGGLHRKTGHLEAALADYDRVSALDPEHPAIDFYRGQVLFEAGEYEDARYILDRFLSEHPTHIQALMVRARSLRQLGEPLLAVRDYSYAMIQMENPTPVLYLESANAFAEAGDRYLPAAIDVLDKGNASLGPLILLQSRAVELEVQARRYEAALTRIDQILSGMSRKETWLARRGEVQELAGWNTEAYESYAEALEAIAALPGFKRQAPAVQALEAKLHERLEGVSEVSGGTN